ncbi:MAG TPA: type IV pilus secretin PilQ [Thermodesulfobacteriota bacterium]|nr:type IV pilus secretin PilQ [Thermodesulfobacteriota bacterium]
MRILIISIALAACILYSGLEAHSSQAGQNYSSNYPPAAAQGADGGESVATPTPAELAQVDAATVTVPQNTTANMPNPSDEYNHIESIGFEVQQGMGIVTVGTSWNTQYERLQDEDKKITLKLKDVILADKFQVSRDVSDFDSPINFISSFRDPIKPNDVIMVIELKEKDVPVDIGQNGNTITMNFGETREQEKIAAEKGEVEVAVKPEDLYAFDFRLTSMPGAVKTYKGQLVSFDFKDADIRDVLRIISDISGLNMIISRNVSGTVTLKLTNVPWDQALDVILEDAGLGAFIDGNVLRVAPLGTLQARQKAVKKAAETSEELEPLITKQVFVNYATAEELIPLVEPLLSDRGELRVDVRTNSILINDTGVRVAQIEGLVADLDTRTPQVLIESRIVQATLNFTRELGIQWGFDYRASAATGNPTGATFPSSVEVGGTTTGSPFGTTGDNFIIDLPAAAGTGAGGVLGLVLGSLTGAYDLDLRLSALEARGDGRVLSSPKVLTLENTPARIEQGVSIPFLSVSAAGTQTQFVDATLSLEVTPQVTNDNRILMTIVVTDNRPDTALTGAGGQPSIRRNEATTQVLASDGETIVIGGIFTRNVTDTDNSLPWFSRLPLLGWLFQRSATTDERRELIVFITPRIIR